MSKIKDKEFFGKDSIGKLLFKMSLPATIGMLVMTLYNVVDSIFIGKYVGSLGLAGVTISFPVVMLIIAIAVGFGIGASSIISRKFGEKNEEDAHKVFGNFMSVVFILSILITVLGLLFIDQILIFLGSTPTILPYAKDYFKIILFGLFFQMFTASLNNIIRSQGNAKTAMFAMIIGAVINIILDYVFIVIYGYGVKGAAYATIISQFVSCLFSLRFFFTNRSFLKLSFNNLIINKLVVSEIFKIGLPSFARQSSMSVVGVIMNISLSFYGGDIAIASYGIVYRLMMILVMPSMGILQGSMPIIGFNYGAKKISRVKDTLILAIKSSTVIIIACYLFIMVFPDFFVKLFTDEKDLIFFTVSALKIMFFALPIVGFQFVAGGFYQAIGDAKSALILSLLRQFIVIIPLILILPLFFGIVGIWYAYPIADIFSGIITFFVLRKDFVKLS